MPPTSLPTRSIMAYTHRLRHTCPPGTRISHPTSQRNTTTQTSSLSTSSYLSYPRKDSQDKDSLVPESNEYSKSGSDAAAASEDPQAAFGRDTTRPEEEMGKAKGEGGEKPLDVSPGNPDVSHARGGTEGGAESSTHGKDRERTSGGGSAPKAGGGKSG
ncbi:hypothetical protein K402DRAFT_395282 [Aulographum hederae CBS 113979]|uniref:Uncharacterized protein n=1 Tax=Aulographum hederae CBS 113979 TaxID=1176131 RepID=A0A6G1GVZ1_9PEZI|nr:hypothetical protein K402DRAFT_395282 [Aulographum hederae CBS 113979]